MEHHGFVHSLLRTVAFDRYNGNRIAGWRGVQCSANISSGRNALVEWFLASPAQWMIMIDTDMVWDGDAVHRLLAVADPVARPIVGGLCFAQEADTGAVWPVMFDLGGTEEQLQFLRISDWPDGELLPVGSTGAAFLLIHRSVCEAIRDYRRPDGSRFSTAYPWFQERELGGMRSGEDVSFCLRAAAVGKSIHVHTGVSIGHIKEHIVTVHAYRAQQEMARGAETEEESHGQGVSAPGHVRRGAERREVAAPASGVEQRGPVREGQPEPVHGAGVRPAGRPDHGASGATGGPAGDRVEDRDKPGAGQEVVLGPALIDVRASLGVYAIGWGMRSFNGAYMLKVVQDLLRYEAIIEATRPDVIIECGTRFGGSALWFEAHDLDVITIDLAMEPSAAARARSKRVTWLEGSTDDPELARKVAEMVAGRRVMVSLDSLHTADHVAAEIKLWGPLVTPDCYLVVEDGIFAYADSDLLVRLDMAGLIDGGSPLSAVEQLLASNPDWQRDTAIEAADPVSHHPAGWWRRKASGGLGDDLQQAVQPLVESDRLGQVAGVELAVVIPTRGRPGQTRALVDAIRHTATTYPLVILSTDADDPTLRAYETITDATRCVVMVVNGQPAGHVAAINVAAHLAVANGVFAIAKLDDDHMPLTHGWDAELLAALRDLGSGIVYANDLLQGQSLPTAVAMTTDIVRELGFMGPPTLRHLYVDNFWKDLGEAAGCLRYLPDVVIEHRHPFAGKAPMDEGYRRANAPSSYDNDGSAYNDYRATEFDADVVKVKALLASAPRVDEACPSPS